MARSRSRSYGTGPLPVQFLGVLLVTMACLLSGAYAQSGTKTMKIVALGDSLSAGLGLLAQDAFPAKNTGFRVRDRWAGWDQAPFTSASHSQVAVFEKLP